MDGLHIQQQLAPLRSSVGIVIIVIRGRYDVPAVVPIIEITERRDLIPLIQDDILFFAPRSHGPISAVGLIV